MSSHESAVRLADDLLFPAALEVDRADRVPASHFGALAREGLYDFDGDLRVVEALASGCLATAFVWLQHLGVLASTATGHPDLHEALAKGRVRGGIARAGARPGARSLTVSSTADGFVLDGQVPWVTGWGMIDIVETAALDDRGNVVFLLVDAIETPETPKTQKTPETPKTPETSQKTPETQGTPDSPETPGTPKMPETPGTPKMPGTPKSLTASIHELVAVNASRTVTLTFAGHRVPADRLVRTQPYPEWQAAEASGSRLNGGLALGVASRCIRLLKTGREALESELEDCRRALLDAGEEELPRARATASELAMRAAITFTVQTGSRSVLLTDHAQRLVREATFLLVFGTRERIKSALLEAISRS